MNRALHLPASGPARHLTAAATSIAAVAAVTIAIYAIKPLVPVLSLGVLYVFAVLPVAAVWGLAYAIPVAVASMLAFNWFFLPPIYTFSVEDGENWFALAVYLVTAVVVSDLAARARRRAVEAEQREREATLLAELATHLLEGRNLEGELGWIGERVAGILGVDRAEIELGDPKRPREGRAPHDLAIGTRMVGRLYTDERSEPPLDVQRRFLPALASLLAVASEREALAREALEAEALRRSDSVKTALLRAVSHDLRSPLTSISTAVGTLRNPTLSLSDDDRSVLLETIEVETERLDRLVADLLDLSRLQAGAASPDRDVWAIEDLIWRAVDAVGARSRVRVGGTEGRLVGVDAGQIERVLSNLVENAVKFSPPDSLVQIRVTATRAEVIVRVVDQGPGIAQSELERIFEPFYRRDDGSSGAGLGLAIARGFAEANNARVWAESRPGQGASFALALPAVAEPAGVPA
jgi:two-component system, OmpR family, sensor histidine kinase KdpD